MILILTMLPEIKYKILNNLMHHLRCKVTYTKKLLSITSRRVNGNIKDYEGSKYLTLFRMDLFVAAHG